MSNKYVEQFLTAMEIISQAQINATSKDNTIEAIISSVESDGSYKVTYQDENFTAYSDAKYEIGDIVFVLRPGSVTEIKDSVIVAKKQTTSSLISEIVEEDISYIELGNNIINRQSDQSYSFDNALLKGLIQRVGAIKIGAKFKTELNNAFFTDDIDLLNYGIKIRAEFKIENGTETREWILDINDMIGVPYYYSDFTLQEKVISIEDPENFVRITSCEFFSNLEEEKGTILYSDISLFAVIERNKITNDELWLINCSNDNVLENNDDEIEIQAVLVSKDEEKTINSYEWYLQNGFGEWQKLENKTSEQLVITKSMLESGAGAIYCIGDTLKSEIIEFINKSLDTIVISKETITNKYIYYNLSASIAEKQDVVYKWYKIYSNLNTYTLIKDNSSSLRINASTINGEAIYLCKAYENNIWIGENSINLIENSSLYTISLSNDYETITNLETKVSTEVRVYLNETLLNEDEKPQIEFNTNSTVTDYSFEWNTTNKCWDFILNDLSFIPILGTGVTFSYNGASAYLLLKKINTNADYSLVLTQDVVNLSNHPEGEIGISVVKSLEGVISENPSEAFISINNESSKPIKELSSIFYSDEEKTGYIKVQEGSQISVALKIKIENNHYITWDSEKIQFIKNGVSFTGITEYYYATETNSEPISKPFLEDGDVNANGWSTTSTAAGFGADKPYLWNIEYISKNEGDGSFSEIEQASVWGQDGREEVDRISYYAVNGSESSAPKGSFEEDNNNEISVPVGWDTDWPNPQQGEAVWEVECIKYNKQNSEGKLWRISAKQLVTYVAKDGVDESGVSLTASSLVFKQQQDNTITPDIIHIERNVFGEVTTNSGDGWSFQWQQSVDNSSWNNIDTTDTTQNIYTTSDKDDVYIKSGAVANQLYIKLTATKDSTSYYDQCMITKLVDGTNGTSPVTAIWSNPLMVFSGDENGDVEANESESSTLHVYEGINEVSPTTFSKVSNDANLTVNGFQVTYTVPTGGSNFGSSGNINGSFNFTFTYKNKDYPISLPWAKTAKGEKGDNGRGILSTTVTHAKTSTLVDNPSSIPEYSQSNPDGWASRLPTAGENEYLWTRTIIDYTDGDDTVTYSYMYQGKTVKGDSITVKSILYQIGDTSTTPPTGTWKALSEVGTVPTQKYLWSKTTFSDNTFVYGTSYQSKDGADSTVPGPQGYSGATITLYKRSSSEPTGTNAKPSGNLTYTFSSGALSGTLNNWSTSIPEGTGPCYAIYAYASSNTDTDTIGQNEWSKPIIIEGINGINTATVFLYKRASSTPSKPQNSFTYTFSTGLLSGTFDGWSQTIPTADGNPCYFIQDVVASSNITAIITTNDWSDQQIYTQDGDNGIRGAKTEAIRIYKYHNDLKNPPNAPTGGGKELDNYWTESLLEANGTNPYVYSTTGTKTTTYASATATDGTILYDTNWGKVELYRAWPGNDSAVTQENYAIFLQTTKGDNQGLFKNEDNGKVYINAEAIQAGTLQVKKDNNVILSAAFDGNNAGKVIIAGWTVTSNALSTSNVGLISSNDITKESLLNSGGVSPIRIYCGGNEGIVNAPYVVLDDGSLYATAAKFSGGNVIIDGDVIIGGKTVTATQKNIEDAQTTANAAQSKAETAVSTANTAKSTANSALAQSNSALSASASNTSAINSLSNRVEALENPDSGEGGGGGSDATDTTSCEGKNSEDLSDLVDENESIGNAEYSTFYFHTLDAPYLATGKTIQSDLLEVNENSEDSDEQFIGYPITFRDFGSGITDIWIIINYVYNVGVWDFYNEFFYINDENTYESLVGVKGYEYEGMLLTKLHYHFNDPIYTIVLSRNPTNEYAENIMVLGIEVLRVNY